MVISPRPCSPGLCLTTPSIQVDEEHEVIEVPVKLFIGRFPKSFDDAALMPYFEPFGKIKECVILRDFTTKQSKGCAFIKFGAVGDAVESIRKLNNKLVLDDDIGPLQVQFANGEVERLGLSSEQIEVPPVKIFVGSLPDSVNEQKLFDMFLPFGEVVETYILHDESSGASKGSGFVKMRRKDSAAVAILSLNKKVMDDAAKPLEVRLAVSRLQRERKMNTKPATPPTVHYFAPTVSCSLTPKSGPAGCNVFVFHIPPDWTEFHLRQYFSNYGYLISATVIRDKHSLASKGFGFVSYDNPYAAQSAVLHMNGFMVGGKRLKVQLKRGEIDSSYHHETIYAAGG